MSINENNFLFLSVVNPSGSVIAVDCTAYSAVGSERYRTCIIVITAGITLYSINEAVVNIIYYTYMVAVIFVI